MKKLVSVALATLFVAACGQDDGITAPNAPALPAPSGVVLALGVDTATGASIETNKDDYSPGEVVHVVGRGWAPGETVTLFMSEDPDTHENVSMGVPADSTGGFSVHYYDVQVHDLGVTFTLTATGGASGSRAVATFTDGNIKFITSPASLVTSATYNRYNGSSNCSTAASSTGQSLGYNTNLGLNGGQSILITIPMVAGKTYTGYSVSGITVTPASNPSNTTLCVAGIGGSGSGTVTLNYEDATPPPPPVAETTTNLASSDNPSVTGQVVTFTATTTRTSGGAAVTSGTITFKTGGANCSDAAAVSQSAGAPDVNGQRTWTQAFNPAQNNTVVRACYAEGSQFAASEDDVTQQVLKAQTTLALSTNGPTYFGNNAVFTAAISVNLPGAGTPTGSVRFSVGGTCNADGTISGGTSLGAPVAISAGSAQASTASLDANTYSIVACYGGDANFLGDGDDESHTVLPALTSVDAGVSTATPQYSDEITLTATVTPHVIQGSELTGNVRFYFAASAVSCPAADPGGAGAGVVASDNITAADDGAAQVNYQVLSAAGSYSVSACFYSTNGNFAHSGDDVGAAIAKEDAGVTSGYTYGNAYKIGGAGTAEFTLQFIVKEKNAEPDPNAAALPGDVDLAGFSVTLNGVGGGGNETGACAPSVSVLTAPAYVDSKVFTCLFTTVAVDAYEIVASVSGDHFVGGYSDAVTVYDPAAGFVTGGGKFTYPGSTDWVSFGLVVNFTGKGKTTPRGNLVVIRHLANGDVCRAKSNSMDAPAVVGNTASFSGRANYNCTRPDGSTYDGIGNQIIIGWLQDNGQGANATGPDRAWFRMDVPNSKLLMANPASTNAAPLTGGNVQAPQPGSI